MWPKCMAKDEAGQVGNRIGHSAKWASRQDRTCLDED